MGIELHPISVNFSKMHLLNDNIAEKIIHVIDNYNVPHFLIEIEFTETAYVEESENLADTISTLREAGVLTSMDDFGTGYSSLKLLQDIDFDVLKIDRSFISDSMKLKRNSIILKYIVDMS